LDRSRYWRLGGGSPDCVADWSAERTPSGNAKRGTHSTFGNTYAEADRNTSYAADGTSKSCAIEAASIVDELAARKGAVRRSAAVTLKASGPQAYLEPNAETHTQTDPESHAKANTEAHPEPNVQAYTSADSEPNA
jgi:hypothetical protein